MQLGPAKEKITSKDFMAKFSSKREVYNFLSIDVGAYLPSYGKTIIYSALIVLFFRRASNDILHKRFATRQEEE